MKKILILAPALALSAAFTAPEKTAPEIPADVQTLLEKYTCVTCHSMSKKLVGPTWMDIAAKGYSAKKIANFIKKPVPGNWPTYPPMAAQPTVPKKDLDKISTWLTTVK